MTKSTAADETKLIEAINLAGVFSERDYASRVEKETRSRDIDDGRGSREDPRRRLPG